jgi:dihydropteroate synthase
MTLPLIMGILNVTPDSFSDGGRYMDVDRAVDQGLSLLDEGADWLDVGGESTRPGALAVPCDEELRRVVPVIRGIVHRRPDAVLSIDTSKSRVAAAAIDEGAHIVNDVTALADPEMAPLCARMRVDVVLMHMRGTPLTMQLDTRYESVVDEVLAELRRRTEYAMNCGIAKEKIYIDPGVGFGKSPSDSARLLGATPRLRGLGFPVVVGCSRKRFIGELGGEPEPARRMPGSVSAALFAVGLGATVVRVHDVGATRQALAVYRGLQAASP